jgi:hypothetical protein
LARVFAELADCGPVWNQALEGWNVKQSQFVEEWKTEGKIKARAEDVIEVLQLRFGTELPADLVQRIQTTTDVDLLKRWLDAAARSRTLNKFRQTLET